MVKREVEIIERTITKPDGTKVQERIEKQKEKEQVKRDIESKQEIVKEAVKSQWRASAYWQTNNSFGLSIERRIAGPFFVGVQATNFGAVGVSIGLEF